MADRNFEEEESNENEGPKALVEVTKFKGRNVLVLRKTPDDQYGFSFGLQKALLIRDNYQAIEKFIEDNTKQ